MTSALGAPLIKPLLFRIGPSDSDSKLEKS
jgi:hypothetical protein